MDKKPGTVEELKITVLADDYAGQNSPFWAQHGAAYLIDVGGKGIRKRDSFRYRFLCRTDPVQLGQNEAKPGGH